MEPGEDKGAGAVKVPYPSHWAGLYGLVGLLAVGGLLTFVRMVRADVKA